MKVLHIVLLSLLALGSAYAGTLDFSVFGHTLWVQTQYMDYNTATGIWSDPQDVQTYWYTVPYTLTVTVDTNATQTISNPDGSVEQDYNLSNLSYTGLFDPLVIGAPPLGSPDLNTNGFYALAMSVPYSDPFPATEWIGVDWDGSKPGCSNLEAVPGCFFTSLWLGFQQDGNFTPGTDLATIYQAVNDSWSVAIGAQNLAAVDENTVRFNFENILGSSDYEATPEPASLAMAAGGGLLIAIRLMCRRARRSSAPWRRCGRFIAAR